MKVVTMRSYRNEIISLSGEEKNETATIRMIVLSVKHIYIYIPISGFKPDFRLLVYEYIVLIYRKQITLVFHTEIAESLLHV